jgi:hypothetical protein
MSYGIAVGYMSYNRFITSKEARELKKQIVKSLLNQAWDVRNGHGPNHLIISRGDVRIYAAISGGTALVFKVEANGLGELPGSTVPMTLALRSQLKGFLGKRAQTAIESLSRGSRSEG